MREPGALGYMVAGRDRMGLPPFSAGFSRLRRCWFRRRGSVSPRGSARASRTWRLGGGASLLCKLSDRALRTLQLRSVTHMSERLPLIVSSRHRYPMTQSWLRPGELLARFFLAPDDNRAASLQSIFRLDSAEIWRLGQQLRSQYLAALLQRKTNKTALDAPDGFSGRTQRSPTADPR